MTVGSLFSGIGGFDLGLERAGFTVKWQVEIDEFARKVLSKHWPDVPKYGDIRAIDWATIEPVDVLCGGFPCQDLSCAGRRAGLREGTRSGLWFEYVKAIRAVRPKYIVVENVSGLLDNHALGRVLGDLAESGYDAEWAMFPASGIGFPHQRKRVWVIAYPECIRRNASQDEIVFNPQGLHCEWGADAFRWLVEASRGRNGAISSDLRNGHGLPNFMDRLRSLGNAIVPQIAEAIGRMILERSACVF